MISNAAKPAMVAAAPLQGVFMGGQQPVAGVTVQLYQAGMTGYGSAATPLGPSVQTTGGGNFDLPTYACTAGSQVYLVGTGGHPTATLTNNNLAMMVGLGTCGGPYLNTFINVNELTTVATVWALSPFMKGIREHYRQQFNERRGACGCVCSNQPDRDNDEWHAARADSTCRSYAATGRDQHAR